MRPVVVVYDIGDDARRARVRAVLGPIADRFQYSGWLVPATPGLSAGRVAAMLDAVIGRGDRVRVLGPCPACRRRARWLPAGQSFSLEQAAGWAVVAHDGGGADAGADRGGTDAGE